MMPLLLEPFPRDPAQEEARRELSKEIYRQQQSLLPQLLHWLQRFIADLLSNVGVSDSGGQVGVLILAVVVVALIAVVLIRFGPIARNRRRRGGDEAAEIAPTAGRAEHRRRADEYAAQGRFAEAVRERLRAIIADLIERDLLDERRGRTAMEIARVAGRRLPGAAVDLVEAAELFGAIWYGDRAATEASDARMREIDQKVAATRPGGEGAAPTPVPSWAIPGADDDGDAG